MPLLKYWDSGYVDPDLGTLGAWFPIAGMHVDQPVLSVHGGTMHGPLTVQGTTTTGGGIHAKYFSGSAEGLGLNANLKLRGRSVDFGGNEVVNVAAPTAPDDGATLASMTTASTATLARYTLTPGTGWALYGSDHGPFQARVAGDGMVTLQGLLKRTATMTPGTASPALTTLPTALRPALRRIFPCAGASISILHRVDVETTGEVRLVGGPTSLAVGHWLSVSDICFYPNV